MNSLSPLVAWLIVLSTVSVAAAFAVQQLRHLRRVRGDTVPADEAAYVRSQTVRRLFGCVLLVAIAGMIAGAYLSGLEDKVDRMGDERVAQIAAGDNAVKPELEAIRQTYLWYWLTVLLLLFALVVVAGFDFLAIRRYAVRHLRQIRDDRKAMLERELATYRRERARRNGSNGHPG